MNAATIGLNAATIALVVIPLVILELGLKLYPLYDLFAEDRRVRGDSKIMWALIIAVASGIGPLIYFFVGRDDSRGISMGNVPAAPAASIARILATWPALAESTDAAVSTTGLTKRYSGGVVALEDLNLMVPSGSIFGFLGPNGAGKTTTLRLLTGLATATAGTGTVAGVKIGGTGGELARNIGYLDQDPRFYGWMRGRELLNMVGQLHGLHGAALRLRVGEVLEIIARLRGTATVFMSTHILNDVERVCDRVAILNFGHLVVEGPIDELLDSYAQPISELEPEAQQPGSIERLAGAFAGQSWAREVRSTPDSVRLFVSDPKIAGPAILPLVVQSGVALARFERSRPSLE